MKFGLGQSAPRVEDQRFLSGRGRYCDDITLPGQARAFVLRSPHAHATFTQVDTAAARAAPGVLGVFSSVDLAGSELGPLPVAAVGMGFERPDGSPAYIPARGALAKDKVAFVGDAVALVVAETLSQAKDAAELVEIDYEPLPAVTATGDARAETAPAVWSECPDNVCFERQLGDHRAVGAGFAQAAHVTRIRLPISRVSISPMEPRTSLGVYDDADGRYTLYEGTQSPHDMRTALAGGVFGIAHTRVRVVSPDMGGGFGLRAAVFPEMVLVLWAARKLARPVKWTAERSETHIADDQGRDAIMEVALALDAEGHFLAIDAQSTAAMGAYLTFFGAYPSFGNIGGLAGPYRTPAIGARVTGVFTNTTPIGPYRGAGRPEATLAVEQLIDLAARELGIDRFELRRRNLIAPDAMPFQTGLSYLYDSGQFEQVMDEAMRDANVSDFDGRREQSRAHGRLRGLGLAYSVEQSAGISDEVAEIRFDPGGSATVIMGSHSHGQGHETVFRQLVADRLGLEFELVRYVQGDTDLVSHGGGTGGSRVAAIGSGALLRATERIVEKGRRVAAHQLETAVDDVEFEAGVFTVAGTDRSLTLAQMVSACFNPAARPPEEDAGLSAIGTYTPSAPTFPNGCHICEIEIDPETGALEMQRYCVVEDVGTVMNPMLLRGQLQGGIVQGFGQIVLEQVVWDETGQPLAGSLMDYALPRADEVPFCEIATHAVPTPTNPLGIKGAGEAGSVGAMPCVFERGHRRAHAARHHRVRDAGNPRARVASNS